LVVCVGEAVVSRKVGYHLLLGLDVVKGPTDWAERGRMPANIDRVGISSKFLQKICLIKESVSSPQRTLVLACKGKDKVHPITGLEGPEGE